MCWVVSLQNRTRTTPVNFQFWGPSLVHIEAHFENALRSRLHRFSRPLPRNSFSSGADHLLGKDHLGGVSIMFIKARSALRRMRCEKVSGLAVQSVSEFQSRPRAWKIIVSIFVFVTFKNEKYERNKYSEDTLAQKITALF